MAKKQEPSLQHEAGREILKEVRSQGLWALELINDEPSFDIILEDVPEDFFGGHVGVKIEFLPAPTKKDRNPKPQTATYTIIAPGGLWGVDEMKIFSSDDPTDWGRMVTHLLLRLKDFVYADRPKTVWYTTGHWGPREIPSDAPCRFWSRLTDMGSIPLYSQMQIFIGDQWEEAQRVRPPVTYKFEVEVQLAEHSATEALNFVKSNLNHKEAHFLSVKLV